MKISIINLVANIVIVLIGGGLVGAWLLHRREGPKAKAAAQLTQSEASERDWGRFQKEIGRLEERISRLERDNEELREDALKSRQRESNLEQKVRSQKNHIERVERRLQGMERIFQLKGITPEIQAELDKLETVEWYTNSDNKSETLRSAEGTCHAAEETVERIKRDEGK